jgi:serine/threonine protein phosphatase PrpC
MRLSTHLVTSTGGRRENEDALKEVVGENFAILVLADGLGGHGGGALAARQCVETVAAVFARAPCLSDAALQGVVDEADRAGAALRLERRKPSDTMRTTVALLAVCGNTARWVHVGDSRIYWFRHNALMQRTRDHSVAEFVAGLQDRAAVAPPDEADRNRLLRVVGSGAGCRAELGREAVALQKDDAFLLCSDGVWSLLSDRQITACLARAATPLDWCVALEQRLRERLTRDRPAEQDNYSMIAGMVMS